MTTATTECSHGVPYGVDHHPGFRLGEDEKGIAITVEVDPADHPRGKCPCCKGNYVYTDPIDGRRRSKHCQHCQAVTADPTKDYLADAPVMKGGPHAGQRVAVMPGADPEDRITALGFEDQGHYVLQEDGNYIWSRKILPPIDAAPPAPFRAKVKRAKAKKPNPRPSK